MTIKPGQPLVSLDEENSRAVLMHPVQQEMANTVAELITWLRACETPEHCFEFQGYLFRYLYEAEERRGQCSRVLKRLRRGQSLPADIPSPPGGDPSRLETWELEAYVFERLARQLRTVGDAFAWTCFGYDRRIILALSRNESPGPMYGKDGLPYELGAIQELWKARQHFALHHDLTNCLRIADLTEFTADGKRLLHEIKAKPHTEKKQLERAQAVVDAINSGGVLPSSTGDSRLVELEEPYVTNLKPLNDLLQLAKRYGCHGMKLPQGRAIVASSLPAMIGRFGHDMEEGTRFLDSVRQQAYKRAGIDKTMHHIKGYSGDTASRSPIMAPWPIYPFTPTDCAGLACDLLFFDTTVSADALVESLERAGLTGEILLAPADTKLEGDMPVVRARWRDRTVTWHAHGLSQLLYELAEPDALARGICELIQMNNLPGEPVIIHKAEATSWFSRQKKKKKETKQPTCLLLPEGGPSLDGGLRSRARSRARPWGCVDDALGQRQRREREARVDDPERARGDRRVRRGLLGPGRRLVCRGPVLRRHWRRRQGRRPLGHVLQALVLGALGLFILVQGGAFGLPAGR